MSNNDQRGNGGKNSQQPRIPTLTHANAAAAAARVVQPGEDASAIAALDTDTRTGSIGVEPGTTFDNGDQPADPFAQFIEPGPVEQLQGAFNEPASVAGLGAPVAREMSNIEMQTMLVSMQDSMAQLAKIVAAQIMGQAPKQAMHTPLRKRNDVEQYAETPDISMEMPTDAQLDAMQRPDQRIQMLDKEIDVVGHMDQAAHLMFLEEYCVVNIHETSEQGAENPVVLGVNGRQVAILRGEDTAVKRKYVEMMLRAKPEGIKTRITRGNDGEPKNHIDKVRTLKYPFNIVMDRNPRGRAWAQKIRSEG